MRLLLLSFIFSMLCVAFVSPAQVFAQTTNNAGLSDQQGLVPGGCDASGDNPCRFADLIELAANFITFVTRVVGLLATISFVIAGLMFISSGANESLRERGKKMMLYAAIGIVLAFAAYGIVNFIEGSLGVRSNYQVEDIQ